MRVDVSAVPVFFLGHLAGRHLHLDGRVHVALGFSDLPGPVAVVVVAGYVCLAF